MTEVQTEVTQTTINISLTPDQWAQLQALMNYGMQAAAVAGKGMEAINLTRSVIEATQAVTQQEPVYGNPDNPDGGGGGDGYDQGLQPE